LSRNELTVTNVLCTVCIDWFFERIESSESDLRSVASQPKRLLSEPRAWCGQPQLHTDKSIHKPTRVVKRTYFDTLRNTHTHQILLRTLYFIWVLFWVQCADVHSGSRLR